MSTCFRVLCGGLRGPGTGLDIASLLESKHKASITDDHLPGIKTLQDSL